MLLVWLLFACDWFGVMLIVLFSSFVFMCGLVVAGLVLI